MKSVPKGLLQEWGIKLKLGEPRSEAERLSKQYLERGEVSVDTVLDVLEACDIPICKHNRGGLTGGEYRSMTLGLMQWGNTDTMMASETSRHPYMFRLLATFLRLHEEVPCTSIVIAKDAQTGEHTNNNIGPSWVISTGAYDDGRLFVEQSGLMDAHAGDSETQRHHVTHKLSTPGGQHEPGDAVCGRFLMTYNTFRKFDAAHLHFTEPFNGTRYALSYHVCRGVEDPSTKKRFGQELRAAGLLVPDDETVKQLLQLKQSNRLYKEACQSKKRKRKPEVFQPQKETRRMRIIRKTGPAAVANPCPEPSAPEANVKGGGSNMMNLIARAKSLLKLHPNKEHGTDMLRLRTEKLGCH